MAVPNSIKLFWHPHTGLVKSSVFCTRHISEGLIFQTHAWGNRKTLPFIRSWSNHLLKKTKLGRVTRGLILVQFLTVWVSCLVEKTDKRLSPVCLSARFTVHEMMCHVLWSTRGLRVLQSVGGFWQDSSRQKSEIVGQPPPDLLLQG